MLSELCAGEMAPGYSGCVKMAATSYRQYDVTMAYIDSDHFTSMWYIQCINCTISINSTRQVLCRKLVNVTGHEAQCRAAYDNAKNR
jgi:hypothetical protein